jgi:glycosyltransferase involved in cell wall biosynthesis
MEAGLPIVSTNNGGQVDLVQHERNGLLVDPDNAAAMCDAIRIYHQDADLAASVGQQNKLDILNWESDAKSREYLDIFADIVGEPVTRPTGAAAL